MALTLMYNGVQFAPVSTKRSIVVSYQADVLWSVVGKFGRQALWMGSVEGQRIFTQLLGGETADYIGAVRVFGIADKMLFEQLTKLDNQEMIMGWQLMTHPMNSNPWPAAFVNFKASIQLFPVSMPGGHTFLEWRMELLTEQHAAAHMTQAMNDIMVVGLSNLTKYMNRSTANSGGSSAGSQTTSSGIVGSALAPSAYGISFMPQPNTAPPSTPSISQALGSQAQLTGNSSFMQQPTYVPGPGQSLMPNAGQNFPPQHLYDPYQQVGAYPQNPALYQQQLQFLQQQQQLQQMSQFHSQHQRHMDPRMLAHMQSFGSGSNRGSPTSVQGQDFAAINMSRMSSQSVDANPLAAGLQSQQAPQQVPQQAEPAQQQGPADQSKPAAASSEQL